MTTTDPTVDPNADPGTDPATDPKPDPTADMAAEAEKWKKLARKHEDQAKANAAAAKELETLKQSSMTDQQKAVEAAKAEARTEALREVGGKLAEASIRVAAAGRNVDVDALVEGIDATKFLDSDGNPDAKAITAWVDKVAPAGDGKPSPKRDLGLGARGQQAPSASNDPLVRALTALTDR